MNISYFIPPSLGNDTSACNGNEYLFNGGAADSYSWSTGETTSSISTSESGIYWVESNTGQCFGRDSVEITFFTIPLTDLGKDSSFCDQEFITLFAFNADAYLWSDGSTSSTINVSSSGNYWVEASNGNCYSRDSVEFEFNSTPNLELGNDTTICQGENIELTSDFASNYLWSDGSSNAFLNISESGLYWLQLSNGECLIRDSITISIKLCDVVIALPNSFTPNGDGFNDKFIPKEFQGIENATLRIINRWGSEIFLTNDLQQGWDGKYNNNSCADGTYYWTVEYSSISGDKSGIAGFVTLIR
jgi:gliding motility-associated-like protein